MRLSDFFDTLPDPRAANVSHRLGDLIVLMIAAAMCGRKTATDIALFAELRAEALSPLLGDVPRPSHDTISRLLRLIDPAELAPRLTRFNAAFGAVIGRHVAVDGRVMRPARDAAARSTPHLMVSPWASEAGLALAAHPWPREETADEGKLALQVVESLALLRSALNLNRQNLSSLRLSRAFWRCDGPGERRKAIVAGGERDRLQGAARAGPRRLWRDRRRARRRAGRHAL